MSFQLPPSALLPPQIVFYNAGCDVHQNDSLGKLKLTTDGILRRDRFVFSECLLRRGVAVCAAIGGGYESDHASLVERHVCLHVACREAMGVVEDAGGWAVVRGRGVKAA